MSKWDFIRVQGYRGELVNRLSSCKKAFICTGSSLKINHMIINPHFMGVSSIKFINFIFVHFPEGNNVLRDLSEPFFNLIKGKQFLVFAILMTFAWLPLNLHVPEVPVTFTGYLLELQDKRGLHVLLDVVKGTYVTLQQ